MSRLLKFLKAVNGNVAVTFAIAGVPMIMAGGLALDYGKASQTQNILQQAVDDAALAAWASEGASKKELKQIVKEYLLKNGVAEALVGRIKVKLTRHGDTKLKVVAKGKIETSFMGMLGFDKMKIKAKSTVVRDFGNIEVALVLDNTGSMNADGKLGALKKAAKVMVNELHDKKGSSTDLKFAIVPFSRYVNVGLSNRNKSWLDVEPDTEKHETKTRNITERVKGSAKNCGTRTWTSTNDGVTTSGTYYACDYKYIVTGTEKYDDVTTNKWYGCVGSRDYPLNVKDIRPGKKIPGLMEVRCAQELTELTEKRSEIISKIDALTAAGETYLPAGLIWGWRALSHAAPLSGGVNYNKMSKKNYTKAIVLMTDGVNTLMPTYPEHGDDGDDQTVANKLTAELCENIKNTGKNDKQNIKIYAITFAVKDPKVKELLRNCATNEQHFFDATNEAALTAAFEGIARSLITLRISK